MSADARQSDDLPVFVYTTFGSKNEAEEVGRALVEARLVACVNIFPEVTSIYAWDGDITTDSEVVMICKTRPTLEAKVRAEIKARHSYDTPALLTLPVMAVDSAYGAWLLEQTKA